MAKSFVVHACLILLTFCPGKGNRRKKIIENYKRDFAVQKRIFHWDNHKIYAYSEYYNEYPNYSDTDYDFDASEYDKKDQKDNISWDIDTNRNREKEFVHSAPTKPGNHKLIDIPLTNTTNNTNFILNTSNEKWPKFEDILLAMGKRYDWKNDRWIKVKKKLKDAVEMKHKNVNTSIHFHEKHRFIYRIVKLNRPKSKRNIILAVTAVR